MTSLDALVAALHSSDRNRRQQAAMRLGAVDASPVITDLVTAMATEPDDFVRETLVWAVVARPAAATPALVAALAREGLPREPVLHALSKIGDPTTVEAVLPFAADEDDVVAAKAWWVLGRIADDAGLAVLLAHLGTTGAARRHGLTRALLQVGEPAIEPLATALTDDDPAVRSHAAEVLVVLADPTRYGELERRAGRDHSARAADILRRAATPEVDGALLLATMSDDRPGLVDAAARLREDRG